MKLEYYTKTDNHFTAYEYMYTIALCMSNHLSVCVWTSENTFRELLKLRLKKSE